MRQQFIHPERLGDVVVRPGVERLNFYLLFAPDGQHDDGQLRNDTQTPAELQAVRIRHGEIGNDQIGRPVAERLERGQPVGRHPHVVAVRRQAPAQHARDLRLVIYD